MNYSFYIKVYKKIKVMRGSIAFSSKHLDHKLIAKRLFLKFKVEERGFAQVRRELMAMEFTIEDSNIIIEEIKKLVEAVS